jgi:hypothetical protein
LNGLDWGINHAENDLNIMDHQIKDHIDACRPLQKRAQPVGFDEHGIDKGSLQSHEGSIKPLLVTNLEDELFFFRHIDQFIRFPESSSYGFFQKDINPLVEEILGDLVVNGSRNGDADSIYLIV